MPFRQCSCISPSHSSVTASHCRTHIVHKTADNSTGYGPSYPVTRSIPRRNPRARSAHYALRKHALTVVSHRPDWSIALGLAAGVSGATSSPHYTPAATLSVDTSASWRPPRLIFLRFSLSPVSFPGQRTPPDWSPVFCCERCPILRTTLGKTDEKCLHVVHKMKDCCQVLAELLTIWLAGAII